MAVFTVIVTGSRDFSPPAAVPMSLTGVAVTHCAPGDTLIVRHGACPTGADAHTSQWCAALRGNPWLRIVEEPFPADWETCTPQCFHRPQVINGMNRCRAAGPRRNTEMINRGADLVLAFPLPGPRSLSRGTWDTIDKAEAAGLRVWKYGNPFAETGS